MEQQEIIEKTKHWVQERVIGWNLCPFAKPAFDAGRVRITVSQATDHEALLRDFLEEVQLLVDTPLEETETTLLVHPFVFEDFLIFNDFLGLLEEILYEGELEEDFQVASFHPEYQFSGTEKDAPGNYTNRSPFPITHILRQASVTRAVASYPEVEQIPERNIQLMEEMGIEKLKEGLS